MLGPAERGLERVERACAGWAECGASRAAAGRERDRLRPLLANATFGWGLRDPGHGMVIANAGPPLDAPPAAILSASGKYGPAAAARRRRRAPGRSRTSCSTSSPATGSTPVRGVYNHAWLMGDESAISVGVQARIDELTEIVRVRDDEPWSAAYPFRP